jgi:UDP-GlcNAc:undecaprenyl-phosphate GlcNAc-1-phosphate transferase
MKTPLELFIFTIFISFFISFLINKYLLKSGFLQNRQSQYFENRWAVQPKPTIGGFSIFIVFLLNLFWLDSSWHYLLLPFAFAFLWGLIDDFYKMPALVKFSGQAVVASLLIFNENQIHIVESEDLNIGFTFFWIVGTMNASNMLDNMDGVLASITLVILFIGLLVMMEFRYTKIEEMYFVVSMMAAIGGFLYFNWSPAKMFMGDAGSQLLGALLAWLGIRYFWGFRNEALEGFQIKQILVPILAFTIPLVDTSTVIFHRLRKRISPFVGGKDHLAHHLVYAGFSEKKAVKILSTVSIISGLIVFFIADAVGTNMWISTNTYLVIAYWLIVWVILQVLYDKGIKP